jgi:hypothetical protein
MKIGTHFFYRCGVSPFGLDSPPSFRNPSWKWRVFCFVQNSKFIIRCSIFLTLNVEHGMLNRECWTRKVEQRTGNIGEGNKECWTRNVEKGTRNDEQGTRNVEQGIRNDEQGTRNVEQGIRNDEQGTMNVAVLLNRKALTFLVRAFCVL